MIDLYDADPTQVSQLRLFLDKLHERKSLLQTQREDIDQVLAEISTREAQCERLLSKKQIGAKRARN